ncbi:MAG: hydroxymethylglutaryl-CoA synthase [Ignisphaera sp.]|nr:hydroxymethylglutaryl-CoA synthase [Ignisphaera sp.]MDW8084936.1 hydroxymethylglutaryl-CoA synthase [Ignisphaera sp.]
MKHSSSGIIGWGVYLPRYRISIDNIAGIWGYDLDTPKGIWVEEKSVGNIDEDSITLGYQASLNAIRRANIDPRDIDAVYLGTESKPYAVKPGATIIAEALGIKPSHQVADLEFACRAASEAIRIGISLVESGAAKYVLTIGADTSQSSPGDVLEFTASSGGAAYIIGPRSRAIAYFEGSVSYSTDTPDFWRRDGVPYPRHGEGFTGEPAYFNHIVSAAKLLMEELGLRPSDFDYAVFHQPNGKFPLRVGAMLGFPKEKVLPGVVTPYIGNTYNGALLIGLAKVLEEARPGQRILAVSFGSGAGSDAFSIMVTSGVEDVSGRAPTVSYYLSRKVLIDYDVYLKMRGLINRYKL